MKAYTTTQIHLARTMAPLGGRVRVEKVAKWPKMAKIAANFKKCVPVENCLFKGIFLVDWAQQTLH